MRPPSYTSNQLHRTEQTPFQAIEDILFNEDAQEAAPLEHAQALFHSFAELIRAPSDESTSSTRSPDPNQTSSDEELGLIQQFFSYKGIPTLINLSCNTLRRRLQTLNLSAEKLMEILTIADNPCHPSLARLGVSTSESRALITTLSDIFNTRGRIKNKIHLAFNMGQNNSDEIIAILIALNRDQP